MISAETLEVSVTYGNKITFFLRMIGIAEEQQLRQKTFGLTEDERAEKEYANNVQVLKDLSNKIPSGMFENKPEAVSGDDKTLYNQDFLTAADAIDAFFAERTILKERIAFYAVRGYLVRLQPSESFF